MKKKIVIVTMIVFALLILLFPVRIPVKDGGTVEYHAILYTVTKRHSLAEVQSKTGLYIGTEIKILFWEVYNDVEFVPDDAGEE